NKRWHTNFTMDQCKNQWLMLVRSNGVIADSVYVKRTKADDTRGRYPNGSGPWMLFNQGGSAFNTFESANTLPAAQVYIDYAPTPTFSYAPGFTPPSSGNFTMWIPDTVNFQINYTITDCSSGTIAATVPCTSEYPATACVGPPPTFAYIDDINTPVPTTGQTEVIRAITIPKTTNSSYTVAGTYAASLYTVNIAQLYLPSFCETNTYFDGNDISVNPGFGCVSICVDPTFTNTASSQTIHVEYFDKFQSNPFLSEGYSNISKGVNDNWTHQQRGFNVNFRDERGFGCALTGNVFNDPNLGVSTRTFFPSFGIKVAGEDNFSALTPTSTNTIIGAHMRDAFVNTYGIVSGLNLDGLHYKPIKGYFNGCYAGIYEFRELADWFYVNHYYGHDKDSIDILEQYGAPIINHGTDTSWISSVPSGIATSSVGVFNQIRTFPMYVAQFYNRVMRRFSQKSFMDFMIYNSYLVNADLMTYNNSWWRGFSPSILKKDSTSEQWRYFMWDMNDVYDLRPPTRALATTNMSVSPCVYNTIPVLSTTVASTYSTQASAYTGHGYILSRMLQNPNFKNDYMNRYMDLLNTTLRCDKMLAHFDYIEKIIEPEMPAHGVVWAVNPSPDWESNRDTLRHRIQNRCDLFQKQLTNCMNLLGPFNITIDVRPAGAGNVKYNSLQLNSYVWSGTYYQNKLPPYFNTYLQATPIDTSAYVFDHWEFSSSTNSTTATPYDLNHTGALEDDSISFVILEGDNIVAVFADKRDDIVLPNGFTPNGDGKNDVFRPLGAATRYARDYDFQIWNRWGQQVFRSTDASAGWDGYYNGSQAQTGVYAYTIRYKNVLDANKLIKGNVTLVR
ncbi:MAG: CotH kinase family protein, partial [Bacteroidia bacterium]